MARRSDGSGVGNDGVKKQKKYYLPLALTRAAAVMATWEGITESAFVERALRRFLRTWKGRKIG